MKKNGRRKSCVRHNQSCALILQARGPVSGQECGCRDTVRLGRGLRRCGCLHCRHWRLAGAIRERLVALGVLPLAPLSAASAALPGCAPWRAHGLSGAASAWSESLGCAPGHTACSLTVLAHWPACWLICIEPHDQHRRNPAPRKSNPLHPRRNFRESRVKSGETTSVVSTQLDQPA